MFVMNTVTFIGSPSFTKSVNLYPPGPYTIVFVSFPIGVAKHDDMLIISAITNVSGLAFKIWAVSIAIGISTAAAVAFEISSVAMVAIRQNIIKDANGLKLKVCAIP